MTDAKLTWYTPDITKENVEALRQLFPEICRVTWNGKGRALRLSQQPTRGTLRPCPEESKDWEMTNNLYIEGDNLEARRTR